LKILLITHYFLPRHVAGTEVYTYRLAKTLSERGHPVHILTGEDNAGYLEPKASEENVLGLPVTYLTPGQISQWRQFRQSWSDGQRPYLEPLFEQLLNRIRPDIVHIQHLATLSASFIHLAKRCGIPVVVMLNDYWFLCQRIQMVTWNGEHCTRFDANQCAKCLLMSYSLPVRWFGKSFVRKASEKRFRVMADALCAADLILSPSDYLKKIYHEHGFGGKEIIHCDYGFPLPDRIEPLKPSLPLKVGFLGSLVPHKGVHVLMDAVNELKGKAHLTIYGSPDSNPKYFKQLRTRDLEYIRFAGVSDPQNPYPALSAFDVIVIPSLWDENSPLVIHEAHAAKRPVIASNVGGIPELIRDGIDGILVPPDDVTALADALDMLANHPEQLLEMSQQAKPPKSIDFHAQEIEGMYRKILSPPIPS
jgi:glycosyltransferase involved in cell wall biosynthesis